MEEIKRLIEDRQIMAVKRDLTKKLMCIVRNMGQSIYSEFATGTGLSTNAYDAHAWMLDEERHKGDELPTAEGDDYSDLGYIYDSLAMSHNFEVRYLTNERELRAKYNGYVVYLEEDGKLKGYVPHPTWEKLTNDLYDRSKPLDDARKIKEKDETHKGFMKQATKFLKELREAWGI